MAEILVHEEADISNNLLFYIENEAKALAERDNFAIDNYIDREQFNPSMENYLSTENAIALLNDEDDQHEAVFLNFVQEIHLKSFLPDWLRFRFRRLKRKVKRIFCQVVSGIEGDINWKDIIKLVLLALIPAFATGVPAVILPIIVGLIAYLIKYGLEKTCPA